MCSSRSIAGCDEALETGRDGCHRVKPSIGVKRPAKGTGRIPVPSRAGRPLPSAGDAVAPASALLRWLGLAAGPLAALGLYAFLAEADGLSEAGRRTLAVAAWMAVWWITEALPIEATALGGVPMTVPIPPMVAA